MVGGYRGRKWMLEDTGTERGWLEERKKVDGW
jgi:hypothetical protein